MISCKHFSTNEAFDVLKKCLRNRDALPCKMKFFPLRVMINPIYVTSILSQLLIESLQNFITTPLYADPEILLSKIRFAVSELSEQLLNIPAVTAVPGEGFLAK